MLLTNFTLIIIYDVLLPASEDEVSCNILILTIKVRLYPPLNDNEKL